MLKEDEVKQLNLFQGVIKLSIREQLEKEIDKQEIEEMEEENADNKGCDEMDNSNYSNYSNAD